MATGPDLATLREILGFVPSMISESNTHKALADACKQLGLPTPVSEGSKYERARSSFLALPDVGLPQLAERVLVYEHLDVRTRNGIQDVLWAAAHPLPISKRVRREIARDLDLEYLVHGARRFEALLDSLWVLDDNPFAALLNDGSNLRTRIHRHVFDNPGDWSTEELFESLGVFEASDRRFSLFLEGMTSADVVPDEAAQRHIATTMNRHLRTESVELREAGTDGGYPVFFLVSTKTATSKRPKNIVFASRSKPDIRIVDAVNNDIEIVGNAEDVLVYDRPLGADGVRWRDLQVWWKETRNLRSDAEAKSTLYKRLRSSLPAESPPQRLLYDLYHELFGTAVYDLPALLPEVWLHWDPKTVRMRGVQAMLRFRMDFLMLLPHGLRVVLEVDGMHHYARNGHPDPARYAGNMRADRELKLSGYEVFRFGSVELQDRHQARETLRHFFTDLFRSAGVEVSPLPA
ncbi:hypothetical protein E0H26_25270 [Micromonospora zingiberis]|uniref:AbiJ-NTD3 domain-containing protein n=1 Tax=Micromonospora zingiberis TaxID=2053011 RepID=A0A4R0G6M9_9ACTN|nr:hypothetical protein [Micromonospora zingiberis]TCB91602.1 hypothetical protein E0H26_25270 [Micromonospora zingiberis]